MPCHVKPQSLDKADFGSVSTVTLLELLYSQSKEGKFESWRETRFRGAVAMLAIASLVSSGTGYVVRSRRIT